jgi:hypothetical protein
MAALVAVAFGLAGAAPAGAVPANGIAIDQAANTLDVTESVHCRPYRHWHRWGYGRGCGYGWHRGWRYHHWHHHRWHHRHHWHHHHHGYRHRRH